MAAVISDETAAGLARFMPAAAFDAIESGSFAKIYLKT